ncbi:Eco57I restriction-modification methylase domain-containing protein [Nocardia camponoti]|nr:N-6 DNA methylase [Nocardia camponoti]
MVPLGSDTVNHSDTAARKRHGRHYTPTPLAEFLARRALLFAPPRSTLRVLDPACGDGALLFAVYRELRAAGRDVELVGYDLDADAVRAALSSGIELACHTGDFLSAVDDLADESFDLVISNPPYVRTQQLGAPTATALRERYGLRGRIDLTHPFVATVPRLLAADGVLGLLCANRFLTTRGGANVRQVLTEELTPVELYDLGDTKLFDAAVLPAITIATRARGSEPCRYVSVYEDANARTPSSATLFDAMTAAESSTVRAGNRTFAVEVGVLATTPVVGGRRSLLGRGPAGGLGSAAVVGGIGTGAVAPGLFQMGPGAAVSPVPRVAAVAGSAESVSSPGVQGVADLPAQVAFDGVDARPARVARSAVAVSIAADEVCEDGAKLVAAARALRAQGSRMAQPETVWRMSQPSVDAWLGKISDRTWRTFGDLARIRVGIKTTADSVFISQHWDEVDSSPEPELLRDLITHHDVEPWQVTGNHGARVLYPYDTSAPRRTPVDLARFPCAARYLQSHHEQLAGRQYVLASGREWYEIWVPQRPHLWAAPKVVFPDISERPRFALDTSGAVVNGDCYWISLGDLAGSTELAYLLMGVANSTLGSSFYDAVCGNRLYAGRRRWITQYVSRLPLPDPTTPVARAIARRVQALVESGAHHHDSRVDELVADAFGVSGEPDKR